MSFDHKVSTLFCNLNTASNWIFSKPKRTLYLLLTPCCLLMAWIPHLIFSCYSIKQQVKQCRKYRNCKILFLFYHLQTEVHLTETLPMNYQLSIQIPLLLLACFNPWLYHKLSIQQCFSKFWIFRFCFKKCESTILNLISILSGKYSFIFQQTKVLKSNSKWTWVGLNFVTILNKIEKLNF